MEFEGKRGNPEAFPTKEGGVQFKCERTPKAWPTPSKERGGQSRDPRLGFSH